MLGQLIPSILLQFALNRKPKVDVLSSSRFEHYTSGSSPMDCRMSRHVSEQLCNPK
jgi:hypothetical protein